MRVPTAPLVSELLDSEGVCLNRVLDSNAGRLPANKYLHWSKLRFLEPPAGLSLEEWWLAVKIARAAVRHELPLIDKHGEPFAFSDSAYLNRMLHRVDRDAAGQVQLSPDLVTPDSRDRYLISSLIEEATTSSQLEGAATSRQVARDMLRTGRLPKDRGETMIFNNYRGMAFLREHTGTALSLPLLLELHGLLTEGTLDDPDAVGRLRTASDQVAVVDQRDGDVLHEPPDAQTLTERLERLFAFANATDATDEEPFVHPVVRAVILHFMIGYDHPFVDGNGRTARALFYWSMARSGYWMMEFLSISAIIRRVPAQYARAYVFSETDDNDATYFLDYNLRVILRAIKQLYAYIDRKARQMREIDALLHGHAAGVLLNYRQRALLTHMQRHPDASYTIESHRRSHNVTYQTARTDLLKLTQRGLLDSAKRGRAFVFTRPAEFEERLRSLPAQRGAS